MTNEEKTIEELRERIADLEHELEDEQGRKESWKYAALWKDPNDIPSAYARWLEKQCERYYWWQWFYFVGIVTLGVVCMILLFRGGR